MKRKFVIVFSTIVSIILMTNIALNFFSTRSVLYDEQKKQMEFTGKSIANSIENSEFGSKYIEEMLGHELRTASIAIKYALDSNIENVTNDQLVELSNELDIAHITLFQETNNDIVGMKSSDPHEVNLSTKQWGYWYTAFQQLLTERKVTIQQGQALANYWTGPFNISASTPNHIDKWGYFYDGTTNYMINPFIRDNHIREFERITGPAAILESTLDSNPHLLEVFGVNPETFGKNIPNYINENGQEFVDLEKKPIIFGTYEYINSDQDIKAVNNAIQRNEPVSFETTSNEKHVIKSFIPVQSDQPYVIGLVTDYRVIQEVLNKQILHSGMISLVLIFIVLCFSYLLANYLVQPIQYILKKVNEISNGNFGVSVKSTRKDELGDLASGVNKMSKNLLNYTKKVEHEAYFDHLTNLPNRRLFYKDLNKALTSNPERNVAVLFFDLDGFKYVNDGYGHSVGNMLLIAVAERINNYLKPPDNLYRISGDEFTIISYDETRKSIENRAQKINELLNEVFHLSGYDISVSTSVGISVSPFDSNNGEELFEFADTAMHHAKNQGKNTYQFYGKWMNDEIMKRLQIEKDLKQAIEREELILQYQPQVDTKTGAISGVEALVRWQHPEKGVIPPSEFIPIAEETKLIIPIGEWILRTACSQLKKWQDSGYPPMRVAVNLSAIQFQPEIVGIVSNVLNETRLNGEFLELEITEGIAMRYSENTVAIIEQLKRLGVKISLDDFGTGYSSLNYLKKFPIDKLKIDKSFVQDIDDTTDNRSIITTIIAMAHNLNFDVVAEGVETKEQLFFLQQNQCYEIQGYFFSKPLTTEEFESLFLSLREVSASWRV